MAVGSCHGVPAVTLLVALDGLAALLALGLCALLALVVRRRVIARGGGTFDCSVRLRPGQHGKGWVLGIGRYAGDALEWYRAFSFSPRPRRVFSRVGLEVLERRYPSGVEVWSLLAGSVVLRCRDEASQVELGMSEDSVTGFLAWVESAPPGVRSH